MHKKEWFNFFKTSLLHYAVGGTEDSNKSVEIRWASRRKILRQSKLQSSMMSEELDAEGLIGITE